MNKGQTAIVGLAIVELILFCFFIPQLLFRMQDSKLSKQVENVTVESTSLFSYDNSIYSTASALTLDEKIDLTNSYDSTITLISLEKGEKYSANQICSIAAGEINEICEYFEDDNLLLKIKELDVITPIREYGNYLELLSIENIPEGEYADVDTIDDADVDLELSFVFDNVEIRLAPQMYINSAEPEQAFIVWTIDYFNLDDSTTIFFYFDDDSGKLLSITGSVANFNNKSSHSLYGDNEKIVKMIKSYYSAVESAK